MNRIVTKIMRIVCLMELLVLATPAMAQQSDNGIPKTLIVMGDTVDAMEYWTPLMDAIIEHESGGNPNAVCGPWVGPMQIAAVLVKESNNILKQRGSSLRFTNNDRRSFLKSKQMFIIIMSKYNPTSDIDKAIRIWAGGIHYSIKGTQKHVVSMRNIMKRQEKYGKKIRTMD